VVVPSAVTVAPELEVDFGAVPPALIPLGGEVVAERIIRQYHGGDVKFYFAVHQNADLLRNYFEFFPNPNVTLVDVGKTISIGDTVHTVLRACPEIANSSLVINFADTVVYDLPHDLLGSNFIVFADTIESERWTLVKQENGKITQLSDKQYQFNAEEWQMLLGVWGFESSRQFAEVLESCSPKSNRNSFYDAMVEFCNDSTKNVGWLKSTDYLDCGHADNYYAAKRKLINARFFNSLAFNEVQGTIRKTSENREKLVDEINWLHELPKELRPFTPTIFDYSKDPISPFLEIEFYSYPSLDDAFVHARFDFDSWVKFFDKLFNVIEIAGKYRVSGNDLDQDLREMYLDKTLARIKAIDFAALLPGLKDCEPTIDGECRQGIDLVVSRLEADLQEVGALSADSFQIVHGDLCFGNILYDPKHSLIKLIDARGRFGRFSIYGDVYYDLAKLSHSILGLYDFIMADRFRVSGDGTNFKLDLRATDYHRTVGEIFGQVVKQRGYSIERIRMIESLLFLSMVPLHRGEPDRQSAMLLRGLSIRGGVAGL
jgi:hypothetical protein